MNGLSILGQNADENLQIEVKLKPKVKITNSSFDPCPSDTIKPSLESSKPESFRLTFNMSLGELSKFI